jgi:hypothetical protein
LAWPHAAGLPLADLRSLLVDLVRSAVLATVTALGLLTAGCGGSEEDPPTARTSAAAEDAGKRGYTLRSSQSNGQDVELTPEVAAAGLLVIERIVRLETERAKGTFDGRCYFLTDADGITSQTMRCGPVVDPDGQTTWPLKAFGTQTVEGKRTIVSAPALASQASYDPDDTLSRPDGATPPADAKRAPATASPAALAAMDCVPSGILSGSDELDLRDAEFLEFTAETPGVVPTPKDPQGRRVYLWANEVHVWDEESAKGYVIQIQLRGVPGEEEVSYVSVDSGVADRAAAERGFSARPKIVIATPDAVPGGRWEMDATAGGNVRVTFPGRTVGSPAASGVTGLDLNLRCPA